MSLIETIDLHNVKEAAWRGGEFAFGKREVLNKIAAQCRFVLVATEQAPGFALGTAGLAAERRVATPDPGYLPSNRSTG
jgi:hypothetical protein